MSWWFSTSATVVTYSVWRESRRTKEVSSSPMAVVWFKRLRSASSRALP